MSDLVHGTEKGDVLHFHFFSLGENEVIDMGGLVHGGCRYVSVLGDISQLVWLEEVAPCSTEVATNLVLE